MAFGEDPFAKDEEDFVGCAPSDQKHMPPKRSDCGGWNKEPANGLRAILLLCANQTHEDDALKCPDVLQVQFFRQVEAIENHWKCSQWVDL